MNKAKIIGIDGLGGSGKTTFSKILQQRLDHAKLFHLDDFIYPKSIRYDQNVSEQEAYYNKQWRYEYLVESILKPLKNGLPINGLIEFYNKENDDYEKKQVTVPTGGTIIVEGVFLQREQLREYFDTVIFIDLDKDDRLELVLGRDHYIGTNDEIMKKYECRYFPAENRYLKEYDPVRLADRVLDAVKSRFEQEVNDVISYIENRSSSTR